VITVFPSHDPSRSDGRIEDVHGQSITIVLL